MAPTVVATRPYRCDDGQEAVGARAPLKAPSRFTARLRPLGAAPRRVTPLRQHVFHLMFSAAAMLTELLTEEQYRELQKLGTFDTKTSSWVKTPPGIRKLGGALFCDRRYDTVFLYHNGADSYYAARGFRSSLRV